jgi:hypothetical protein
VAPATRYAARPAAGGCADAAVVAAITLRRSSNRVCFNRCTGFRGQRDSAPSAGPDRQRQADARGLPARRGDEGIEGMKRTTRQNWQHRAPAIHTISRDSFARLNETSPQSPHPPCFLDLLRPPAPEMPALSVPASIVCSRRARRPQRSCSRARTCPGSPRATSRA